MPSCDGYASCSAPFWRTFAVEIPSTEKFTMEEVAPPSAKLPWLSSCTLAESVSAPSGLVVTARLLSGNCVISALLLVSPIEPSSVFIWSGAAETSTVVASAATASCTFTRRSCRATSCSPVRLLMAKPSCAARRLYLPGLTFSKTNAPVSSLLITRSLFSSSLCSVTAVAGMAEPVESVAAPRMLPRVDCAAAVDGIAITTQKMTKLIYPTKTNPSFLAWD